jgi:enoyl-CoA hydratase
MGLVNRVVAPDDLEAYVRTLTDQICANAPLTIKAAKLAIGEILKDESKRDVAGVDAAVEACFASQDYAEGRTAFMEKRKPAFQGK